MSKDEQENIEPIDKKVSKYIDEQISVMRKYIDEKIDYDVGYWKRQLNEKYAKYEDNAMAITITKLLCGSAIGITAIITLCVIISQAI